MSDSTARIPLAQRDRVVDPAEHIGLAWHAARRTAQRYGGLAEDYLGACWETLDLCCRGFDSGKARFSTYAMRAMLRAGREQALRDKGYRFGPGRRTIDRIPTIGPEAARDAAHRGPSPLSDALRAEEMERAADRAARLQGEVGPGAAEAMQLLIRLPTAKHACAAIGAKSRWALQQRLKSEGIEFDLVAARGESATERAAQDRRERTLARRARRQRNTEERA